MKSNKPLLLQRTATTLIDLYGSARRAADKVGINYSYLYRMSTGEMDNASDKVLYKLGLERVKDIELHKRKEK